MNGPESLSWVNRFVKLLIQDLEEGASGGPPYHFSPGDNYIVFKFTPDEFNEIVSALSVGADFAYPEKSHQVYWNFVRNVEQMTDICDLVSACIENNPNTRAAIQQLINNSLDEIGREQDEASANENRAAGLNLSCNPDVLYGQCLSVIQTIHRAIEDMLEGIESTTNLVEVGDVLANLPVIENIGISSITSLVDLLIEGVTESYNAQYNQALELELACYLFCLCQGDCEITTERIYQAYFQRLREQFDTAPEIFFNFGEVITYLSDAEIDSDVIVTALHFLLAAGVRLFGGLLGVGAVDRVLKVALALAQPNALWVDCLCGWESDLDLTVSSYDIQPLGVIDSGSVSFYVAGLGFSAQYALAGGNSYRMFQQRIALDTCIVTRIEFNFTLLNGNQTIIDPTPGFISYNDPGVILTSRNTPFPDGPDQTYVWAGYQGGVTQLGWRIQAGGNPGPGDPGGAAVLYRIKIRGVGPKPSQLP